MSFKDTYDMVNTELQKQGKDLYTEIEKLKNEGRCRTSAAALNTS